MRRSERPVSRGKGYGYWLRTAARHHRDEPRPAPISQKGDFTSFHVGLLMAMSMSRAKVGNPLYPWYGPE